jgi:hypothetical protein
MPGSRLAGSVADRLAYGQRFGEFLASGRVVGFARLDRGQLMPGSSLAGPVANGLSNGQRFQVAFSCLRPFS